MCAHRAARHASDFSVKVAVGGRPQVLTFAAASQSKGCYTSNNAEDIMRQGRRYFARGRVGSMKRKAGS